MKKLLTAMTVLVLMAACATSAERAERDAQMALAVNQALESRHYKVSVQSMHPRRGRMVNVTSDYSLEVLGDTLVSYLPYFGRAYNIPFNGGKGMNFTAPILRYEMQKDAKGRSYVMLVTDNKEDVLTYRLEIFSNGRTSIFVNAREREPISYEGRLDVDD